MRSVLKKILPYAAIVMVYIVASIIQGKYNNVAQFEFEQASRFNALRTFFGGYYSFFLSPDSVISSNSLLTVSILMPIALAVLLYYNKNRKMMLFGLGWVFVAFLPQSYSTNTAINLHFIAASLSRHLYLPSIGAAIVISTILLFSFKILNKYVVIILVVGFSIAVLYNGSLVHKRSLQWVVDGDAVDMRIFLRSLKSVMPSFEDGAHLIVEDPPRGRAEMSGALLSLYQNKVFYMHEETSLDIREVKSVYLIQPFFGTGQKVNVIKLK